MSKDEVGVPAAGRLLFSSIGRNLDEKKSGGVFKLKQKNEEEMHIVLDNMFNVIYHRIYLIMQYKVILNI